MENTDLQSARSFTVKQRIKMVGNEYWVLDVQGNTIAYAKQKMMALKERVTFFTDESKTQPVFSFQARNVLDAKAVCDVFDGEGRQIGYFQKDFAKSLIRSTFYVDCAAGRFSGQEKSMAVGLLRRFGDLPLPYDFEFVGEGAVPAFHIARKMTLRDSYQISIANHAIDGRVVAALAVALDVLQNR